MNDRIHELLHRNLQEVFGEGDAVRRRAALDELYTEDCVLYVPPGTFVGREALDTTYWSSSVWVRRRGIPSQTGDSKSRESTQP